MSRSGKSHQADTPQMSLHMRHSKVLAQMYIVQRVIVIQQVVIHCESGSHMCTVPILATFVSGHRNEPTEWLSIRASSVLLTSQSINELN